MTQKFQPGRVVATPGAMKQDPMLLAACLKRHLSGDWGELCAEDRALNDEALRTGEARLFSSYPLPDGSGALWVITEWDRSVTTLLLPSEY